MKKFEYMTTGFYDILDYTEKIDERRLNDWGGLGGNWYLY